MSLCFRCPLSPDQGEPPLPPSCVACACCLPGSKGLEGGGEGRRDGQEQQRTHRREIATQAAHAMPAGEDAVLRSEQAQARSTARQSRPPDHWALRAQGTPLTPSPLTTPVPPFLLSPPFPCVPSLCVAPSVASGVRPFAQKVRRLRRRCTSTHRAGCAGHRPHQGRGLSARAAQQETGKGTEQRRE
jgi:hypothetical protein